MDTPTFLVADSNLKFLEKSEEILREAGYQMIRAADGVEARAAVEGQDLTGVLAHMDLPGLSGIELCRSIKSKRARGLPVILMCPEDPEGVAIAESAKADNILFRPVKRAELLFCARSLIRLRALLGDGASKLDRRSSASEDVIGSQSAKISQFEFFKAFLTVEIKRARRYGFPLSVLLASLDQIEAIEQRYGEKILRQLIGGLARAIRRSVRDIDIPVTLRDDTILVLMPHTDQEGAAAVAERIRRRIRRSVYREDDLIIRPTISIGKTTYDRNGDRNFSQVVRRASKALRQAMRQGGDQVVVI